jgi:hypothetical protein
MENQTKLKQNPCSMLLTLQNAFVNSAWTQNNLEIVLNDNLRDKTEMYLISQL